MAARKQRNSPSPSIRTIDLHGLRVEEAKERLLDMLDNCLREGVDQLRVVHGFGTGKIKAAVHEIAKSSRHVKNSRTELGNGGVTILYL